MAGMDVARHIQDRTPRGIAAAISRLVRSGELRPGDRLPTVRALAVDLQVSPATVSGAWQALAAVGLVESRGRAGTVVLPEPAAWLPPRYREMQTGAESRREVLDLSTGTPDPTLLPPLGPALARVAAHSPAATTESYLGSPLIEPLERLLRASWPFHAPRLTVVDGAVDAISRTLEQLTGFGGRVVVEDPGFPPVLDLCDQLGLERIPVPVDRYGMVPAGLARALRSDPQAVLLQPRAHNPTGASLTAARARELAAVLRSHRATGGDPHVIEDDHCGQIASSPDVSLGQHLPDRVVHIRSYSKSHGPDLRIAAVGGPAAVLDRLIARRMLGPGWTSRLLQRLLVDLLTDGDALDAVAQARRTYYARQRALVTALARHGLTLEPADGINLWLPVADESAALVRLAAAGVRVAPGRPFRSAGAVDHVRVSLGALSGGPAEVERVAHALATAAGARHTADTRPA